MGKIGALILVGLLVSIPAPAAAQTLGLFTHEEVSFTNITLAEEVAPWKEEGYIAATRGGLVLWPGDGARTVVTRQDGLPSNAVWDFAHTKDGLLVATEFGAALVDPDTLDVTELDPPGRAGKALDHFTTEVHVANGRWYVMDRGGNVTVRSPDGVWTAHEPAPLKRANDLSVGEGRVLVAAESSVYGIQDQGLFELADDGTWVRLATTEQEAIRVAQFQDLVVAGTRDGGLEAFDSDGDSVSLSPPDDLAVATPLALAPFGSELWVGSDSGVFIFDAGNDTWREPNVQLPYTYVRTLVPLASSSQGARADAAILATTEGIAIPNFEKREGFWVLHRTVNGPTTSSILSLSEHDGLLWVGTTRGFNVYDPEARLWGQMAFDQTLRARTVYHIQHEGNFTWFATDAGVYQLNRSAKSWRLIQDANPNVGPGNEYFDLEKDELGLWMPEWKNRLIRHEAGTNHSHEYQIQEGLISHGLTCAERWHEFLAVCSIEAFQLFNLSRSSPDQPLGPPYDRCNNYACNYTAPWNRSTDVVPDGPRLWLASEDAGLGTIERHPDQGVAVTRTWTENEGLPSPNVRSLAPASGGVWAGTTLGLARVDLDEGVTQTFTRADGLDEPAVNDILQKDDLVYVATLSGLYRLEPSTGDVLPLYEAGGEFGNPNAHLSIDYPPPGSRLAGPVNMTGTARLAGSPVEAVEVAIDDGSWEPAKGHEHWSYRLPVDELDDGDHQVHVRALFNGTAVANETLAIQVRDHRGSEPEPPTLDHDPPKDAFPGSLLELTARVDGDEPLRTTLEVRVDGRTETLEDRTSASRARFPVRIPNTATDALTYRFHVQSPAGDRIFPTNGSFEVPIEKLERHDLALSLPESSSTVRATPGDRVSFPVQLSNGGTVPENVRVSVDGLHAHWAQLSSSTVVIPPGDSIQVQGTLQIPEDPATRATQLFLTAETSESNLQAMAPLTIQTEEDPTPQQVAESGEESWLGIPGPSLAIHLALLALVAVVVRFSRRRSE